MKRGVVRDKALTTGCARKGPWRMSKVLWVQIALPDAYFKSLYLSMTDEEKKTSQKSGVCWLGHAIYLLPN